MDWDDGRIFLVVAREGQMLSAARKLGVNQTTLSRKISNLEADLQATLLVRGPGGCVLTEAGHALMAKLERAETAMLEGEALFQGGVEKLSGTVRVGAPDGFGVSFLAPRLTGLLDKYPDLKVELVPVPRSFSLSQREADIAIMVGRPKTGRLVIKKLTDYTLGLYASRSYLEEHGLPACIDDLKQHRLVGYVEDLIYSTLLNYASEVFQGAVQQLGISSAVGQLEAVRAGAGIGVLHDYLAKGDAGLVRLLEESTMQRSYWIAYHESQREIRRVQAVADHIGQVVRQHHNWVR
ncbi:LysR family transcriptional regulator [Aestuariispira ectoiniformans]|uniref:LysR family transcriptional regulator n=1 Tax=Aestuariispira ectoiniformans TaxID=2775080 RepID=UPI00223BD58C|nr:LysR family transcriptional regulator [Aestuariispira ectoiniformans]